MTDKVRRTTTFLGSSVGLSKFLNFRSLGYINHLNENKVISVLLSPEKKNPYLSDPGRMSMKKAQEDPRSTQIVNDLRILSITPKALPNFVNGHTDALSMLAIILKEKFPAIKKSVH